MAAGSHLSIGEVLSLVQDEFPDVTISKIRFLESQGLLNPERTPSGYRKFYERDIERLEWILAQQRDNFLPLKVIRERLDEWDTTGERPEPETTDAAEAATEGAVAVDAGATVTASPASNARSGDPRRAASSLAAGSAMEVMPERSPATSASAPAERSGNGALGGADGSGWQSVHGLTVEELAAEAVIDKAVVEDLLAFSLISARTVGGEHYFDDTAVDIARASRAFIDRGIEVRHLRMYKVSAQREAGVLEQLVMPVLKQRNPDAHATAVDMVNALAEAGRQLHEALLQTALDDALS